MRWSPPLRQLPACTAGGPDHLPEEYRYRFNICCDRACCRKRMTPPSVRFLGRKVYLGAVVILIIAMLARSNPFRSAASIDSGGVPMLSKDMKRA